MCDALEDLDIFLKAKNITPSMAIDKDHLTQRCKLELRFQALDVILVGLSLGQNLPNETQSMLSMEARDVRR